MPALPWLSVHVPSPVAGLTNAETCADFEVGRPMVKPITRVPEALNAAVPMALPLSAPPHWSSVPSTVKPVGRLMSVSCTELQYGCICHEKVPNSA